MTNGGVARHAGVVQFPDMSCTNLPSFKRQKPEAIFSALSWHLTENPLCKSNQRLQKSMMNYDNNFR